MAVTAKRFLLQRRYLILSALLVTALGYITYFHRYSEPPFFFWDENYHVAHAQKYLNGVFFMEPHPPLGKLLIALGEKIVHANSDNSQFIGTDHAKYTPDNFSFAGYRLFPALLAWLTAPLLFFVFYCFTRRWQWSLLLSFLYLFDNALIVHSRGAMLEGIQFFFIALMVLAFAKLYRGRARGFALWGWSSLLGIAFAAAMTTKINALILIILIPIVLYQYRNAWSRLIASFSCISVFFVLVYVSVWQTHFVIGQKINSNLSNAGFYQASAEYKQLLKDEDLYSPRSFYIMLRDSFAFIPHYQKGVPKLNLCNQSENGSPAIFWPLGGRSINYRWERKGNVTQYLYLQSNPIGWALGLLGVLGCSALLLASWTLKLQKPLRQPLLMATFVSMYLGYMLIMASLTRVMYLYHYFIPLLFAFILFGLLIREIRAFGRFQLSDPLKTILLGVCCVALVGSYSFFSPLTYAKPLTESELKKRSLLSIWDLRCPNCDMQNGIALPLCDPKVKSFPDISISGVRSNRAFQDWGEPRQNTTVEQRPIVVNGITYSSGIGTHAASTLEFPINGRYKQFTGMVGLPDYLKEKEHNSGSVKFEIVGDGKILWRSKLLRAGDVPESFTADVTNMISLQLIARDAEDGIDDDHAVWLNLVLQ